MTANTESVISPDQQTAIATWIGKAAPIMLLADWSIVIGAEPPDSPGSWADTNMTGSYYEALIRINARLLNEPETRIREVLIHELVHLHHTDLRPALLECIAPGNPETERLLEATVDRYVERMVDQLARVIANHTTLPSLAPILKATPAEGVTA